MTRVVDRTTMTSTCAGSRRTIDKACSGQPRVVGVQVGDTGCMGIAAKVMVGWCNGAAVH